MSGARARPPSATHVFVELPPVPPGTEDMERNVVITMWDWRKPTGNLHDEIGTDKRNPTLNANDLVYAADYNETIAGGRG
jgi:hypothetical protein